MTLKFKYANEEQTAVTGIVDGVNTGTVRLHHFDQLGVTAWVAEGNEIEAFETAEEVTAREAKEAEATQKEATKAAKLAGVEFEGVMCSVTAEDMWGLNAAKDWVELGNSTNFEFSNGNVLTLTPDNLVAFQTVWMPFRASFFE